MRQESMRNFAVAVGFLAPVLVLGTVARADLSMNGAEGLPLNPTAQMPAPGGVEVQADYHDIGDQAGSVGGFTGTVDFKFYGVHAAFRPGSLPLEINGGYERLRARATVAGGSGSASQSGLALGAKYLLIGGGNPTGVQVAIGGGYSRAFLRNQYAYLVASKNFGGVTLGRLPITGHLGLRYDRVRIKPRDFESAGLDIRSYEVSAYAGVEVPLTRRGDWSVVGELQTQRTSVGKNPYSAGVRYAPRGGKVSGLLGVQRNGITGDNGLFAVLNYKFHTLP